MPHLDALRALLLLMLRLQRQEGPLPAVGHDVVGRRAVHALRAGLLLLQDVALRDHVEEGQRAALRAVVRVRGVHRLEQVTHVPHVDAGLPHCVRLLHHLTKQTIPSIHNIGPRFTLFFTSKSLLKTE